MIIDVDKFGTVKLGNEFLAAYRDRPVPWGFGDLSWIIYKRTYSRGGEAWWQTCQRVIEGMLTVQKIHLLINNLTWNEQQAIHFAREAYDRMWRFKWTPPGRGLWIMGTRYMYEQGGAALNNCGFVSTKDIAHGYSDPFVWMMSMTMLGVGVGFDTRGKGQVTIHQARRSEDVHNIDDSREGWRAALKRILDAYTGKGTLPKQWDYSQIRPAGTPLKRFGGVASGAVPLRKMIETLEPLYESYVGQKVDARLIVDTMNIVGRCVVAGGIRRSAQIAFGDADDTQFLDLKMDAEKVSEYRWTSNNSVLAEVGMDYGEVAKRTATNGEPGYLWLDNARAYGRLKDRATMADQQAEGSNPCVEQTLWDKELCCLVETFPANHDTLEDYLETLRYAYGYAKTVTLIPTHDQRTNAVMLRNRRIGCSMTGIVQAINRVGYRTFFNWCERAYAQVQWLDKIYSDWLCIPRSLKTTSVKPSGTVSLLAGATPGVHWEHAPYYIRRMRITKDHPLEETCRKAGYRIEVDHYADNTLVVDFPMHITNLHRGKAEVPLREKVGLAARMQYYWSDNQVSCTAEFDPEREKEEIPRILTAFEDQLKGIVFLPSMRHGYAQPPYEAISKEQYDKMVARLRPVKGELPHELETRFCDGAGCVL